MCIISSERVMYTSTSDYYCVFTLSFFLLAIKVGDRCQVEPGEKRGVVKFVGQAETLGPGFWIGVQYDEPLGKHDGMYVNSLLSFPSEIRFIKFFSSSSVVLANFPLRVW